MGDKVSIIVPSYKRHRNLVERAIKSLLDQTYKDIEIVIVDDNAKPELIEYRNELTTIVSELNDSRILLVKNQVNCGGAVSRNNGVNASSGDYITFLDDDDRYLPGKVEKQLAFMQENKSDMSFTDLVILDERENVIDIRDHLDIKQFDTNYLFHYHLVHQITGTPTFMLKKSLFVGIGGFDDVKMGQEFYLMAKIIKSNANITYMHDCDIRAYRYDIEAISTGPNKISGQKALYKYKKSFFKELRFREKAYIRCRHYAVMAVAYKRNKKYFKALFSLMIACLASPYDTIHEYFGLKRRKKAIKEIK